MLSILVITHNEEENIGKCLDSIAWCDDVVVVDSGSTDRTSALCDRPNVRFLQHPFAGWAAQRQWALDHVPMAHDWVLSLDADETVSCELRDEMLARAGREAFVAYEMAFRLVLWGKWLKRSSHYPVFITRLYRKDKVRYAESGATDVASIDGPVGRLAHDLYHVNYKPLEDWLAKHVRYAAREADRAAYEPFDLRRLLSGGTHIERRQELKKLWAKVPMRPALYFCLTYVGKGGFLDGAAGFRLAFLKATYEYWVDVMRSERVAGPNRAPEGWSNAPDRGPS